MSSIKGQKPYTVGSTRPSIAVGKLFYGSEKSGRAGENLARIDTLVGNSVVSHYDADTALQYGHIKNGLKIKGNSIPENDIWIAALAMRHDLILVTRDAHFQKIDSLRVTTW